MPSPLLDEVNQLDESGCERLGITLYEPATSLVLEATAKRGGLSFYDQICLAVTRELDGVLYSNDRPLLKVAQSDGMEARWGLQLLLDLVKVGKLTFKDSLCAAEGICGRSRFPKDQLLKEFRSRLDEK